MKTAGIMPSGRGELGFYYSIMAVFFSTYSLEKDETAYFIAQYKEVSP